MGESEHALIQAYDISRNVITAVRVDKRVLGIFYKVSIESSFVRNRIRETKKERLAGFAREKEK